MIAYKKACKVVLQSSKYEEITFPCESIFASNGKKCTILRLNCRKKKQSAESQNLSQKKNYPQKYIIATER